MRELGALDESDQPNPRVTIPNYIQSVTIIIASESRPNECKQLMSHLNAEIDAPEAEPSARHAIDDLVVKILNMKIDSDDDTTALQMT